MVPDHVWNILSLWLTLFHKDIHKSEHGQKDDQNNDRFGKQSQQGGLDNGFEDPFLSIELSSFFLAALAAAVVRPCIQEALNLMSD